MRKVRVVVAMVHLATQPLPNPASLLRSEFGERSARHGVTADGGPKPALRRAAASHRYAAGKPQASADSGRAGEA